MTKLRRSILAWLLLAPLVLVILFPYAVMLITAVKPANEVLQPRWLPSEVRLTNFVEMWERTNFGIRGSLAMRVPNRYRVSPCTVPLIDGAKTTRSPLGRCGLS